MGSVCRPVLLRCVSLRTHGLLLAVVLGLAGCAGAPPAQQAAAPIPDYRFDASVEVPTDPRLDIDVLALDAEVRAALLARVDAGSERRRLQQLVELIQSPQQLGLRYAATATRTAMETLHSGEGNCLALSALFVALARAAGLDARFQDVELLPNWRQDGDVFVIERHINAVVVIGGEPLIVDFLVQPAGTAARSRLISDRAMTAQYLNNIGVEHLAAGRTALAYRFFRRSIEAAPDTAYLWTNLGVALARNGQRDAAESAYLQAAHLDGGDAVALSNLAALYEAGGRGELAQSALARVQRLRLSNPYYLYWQADRRYRGGDYAGAIAELRAAIALKPEEGAFHFALARAYIGTGALARAESSLASARRYAADAATGAAYAAEYRALLEARTAVPAAPPAA